MCLTPTPLSPTSTPVLFLNIGEPFLTSNYSFSEEFCKQILNYRLQFTPNNFSQSLIQRLLFFQLLLKNFNFSNRQIMIDSCDLCDKHLVKVL